MLVRHSAVYLVGRGASGLLAFVALAAFSRLLTPDAYGRYALVVAAVGLVDVLALRWLRLGLLRTLPDASVDRGRLLPTIAGVTVRLLAGIVAAVGVALAAWRPEPAVWGLAAAGTALLAAQALFEANQEVVRTELAPGRYGAAVVTRAAASLAVGVALVLAGWGAAGPLAGAAAGFAAAVVLFAGPFGRPGAFRGGVDGALARSLAGYGLPLAATAALGFVVSSSDRFLLAWLLDTSAAGRYALGYDVAQASLGALMMVVNLAAYPLAVRALEREGVEAARTQLGRNVTLLVAIGAPAAAGMALLADNVTGVLLGSAFQDAAARIVPWIAAAALLAGLKAYYVDLGFQLGRRTVGQVWVMAVAAGVNVALNLAWIPRFGLAGAVHATWIAYLVALLHGAWAARRVFPLPAPPRATLGVLVAVAAMGAALVPVRGLEGPLALAAQVTLGAAAYGVALALVFRRAAVRAARAWFARRDGA